MFRLFSRRLLTVIFRQYLFIFYLRMKLSVIFFFKLPFLSDLKFSSGVSRRYFRNCLLVVTAIQKPLTNILCKNSKKKFKTKFKNIKTSNYIKFIFCFKINKCRCYFKIQLVKETFFISSSFARSTIYIYLTCRVQSVRADKNKNSFILIFYLFLNKTTLFVFEK